MTSPAGRCRLQMGVRSVAASEPLSMPARKLEIIGRSAAAIGRVRTAGGLPGLSEREQTTIA